MTNSQTDIIATIGRAMLAPGVLRTMMEGSLNIARVNFSWDSQTEHAQQVAVIRATARDVGRSIPILQDLSGPRMQAGAHHHFDSSRETVLTEKDLADLDFGAKEMLNFVALSFVAGASDIEELRLEMAKRNFHVPIIAKIERKIALDNIDEIIAASDAIMIARGDLGNEIPLEQIPFVQKTILTKCKAAQKSVIVATQMLLSMTKEKEPTRAEVTDVYQAVLDGADAVMLSEESASGLYPAGAVEEMERIVVEAERHATGRTYYPLSALV